MNLYAFLSSERLGASFLAIKFAFGQINYKSMNTLSKSNLTQFCKFEVCRCLHFLIIYITSYIYKYILCVAVVCKQNKRGTLAKSITYCMYRKNNQRTWRKTRELDIIGASPSCPYCVRISRRIHHFIVQVDDDQDNTRQSVGLGLILR